MPLVDAVERQFDEEAPRRVLERVPLDREDGKPRPRSMTLGRLAPWPA